MKKSLIALAVAGAMTAPMIAQADATLYGSFRIGLQKVDNGDTGVDDQSSRFGIKGDIDLGLDGTKGLFHWEAQANNATVTDQTTALGSRLHYIGAQGDWGKLLIGKQYHPHYLLISGPTNIFNPGDGGYGERFNLGNSALGKTAHFMKRTENTIAYYTPKMNGFQFIGGVVLATDGNDSNDSVDETVDAVNLAGTYSANNFTVSASYGTIETANTPGAEQQTDVWGLAAQYKLDALQLMAKYEDKETETGSTENSDERVWELAARYTMGATSVYGRYADYEDDVANSDFDQWGIGVQQKLGKGRVFAEYVDNDSDDTANPDRAVLGYRVDF
ncbi:porin [Neptuniibacter sp. QD48_11]|uniref:porin n=1 Tax=unclassified Neptuniibacter TaxID=2630693 RepID=UPI0039F6155A